MQFRAIELVGIIFIGLLGVLMSQACQSPFWRDQSALGRDVDRGTIYPAYGDR